MLDGSPLHMRLIPVAPSEMCASRMKILKNCGFNGTFPFTFNLPEKVKIAINTKVIDKDAADAVEAGLLFSMVPIKVPETAGSVGYRRNVVATTQNALLKYLHNRPCNDAEMKGVSLTKLSDVNAAFGMAKQDAVPDVICVAQTNETAIGLAVIELKDTAASPLEQIGQAYTSGCNIILSHLKLGIPPEDCAVPLALTNGNLYQFGWVTLLKPSFPVLHLTTGILDANICLETVSAHLTALKRFCIDMTKTIVSSLASPYKSDIPESSVCLSSELYHLKEIKDIFFRWEEKEEESFHYMWKIYEALKDVSEVVKPLAYSEYILVSGGSCSSIIFSKVKDYSMGVPLEENLFKSYLDQMKMFLKTIHERNVIHMDLYPSNILWKKIDDKIKLQVVDWDIATFNQTSFSQDIEKRLKKEIVSQYYYKKVGPAEPKCDYWFLYILSLTNHEERKEMNGNINQVNRVYRDVVNRCCLEAEGRSKLTDAFESWYETEILAQKCNRFIY